MQTSTSDSPTPDEQHELVRHESTGRKKAKKQLTAKEVIATSNITHPPVKNEPRHYKLLVGDEPSINFKEVIQVALRVKGNRRHVALPYYYTYRGQLREQYHTKALELTEKDDNSDQQPVLNANNSTFIFGEGKDSFDRASKKLKLPSAVYTADGNLRKRAERAFKLVRKPDGSFDKVVHTADMLTESGRSSWITAAQGDGIMPVNGKNLGEKARLEYHNAATALNNEHNEYRKMRIGLISTLNEMLDADIEPGDSPELVADLIFIKTKDLKDANKLHEDAYKEIVKELEGTQAKLTNVMKDNELLKQQLAAIKASNDGISASDGNLKIKAEVFDDGPEDAVNSDISMQG